jgi:MFS family permease
LSVIREAGSVEKKNFLYNVIEGALFVGGGVFISSQTVLPSMVKDLGGSNLAVGAVGVIVWTGLFLPQVFAARYAETLEWKKPWVIRFGMIQRIIVGVIAAVLFFYGVSSPHVALGLFLLLFSLMQIVLGITTPAWFDLVAKVTPVNKRGRLAGFRGALGGVLGFLAGLVLTWVLARYPFPSKYILVFSIACAAQCASLAVQTRLVESEPGPVVPRKPVGDFAARIVRILRDDRRFLAFLLASACSVLATISISFFTVYAMERFTHDPAVVGIFTLLMIASTVLSAPLLGLIADRKGNRITLIVTGSALLCASVWAVLASSLGAFSPVFMLLGMYQGSEMMARYNMAIEFAPDHSRPTYLGMMNALLAPLYAVSLFGGWLSDQMGYAAVFLLGSGFAGAGIVLMILLVRDPRFDTGKHIPPALSA